jgi:hypothetical protein
MINIITSFYYIEKNDKQSIDRNEELIGSLKKNISNNFVDKIFLYIDNINALNIVNDLNSEKIYIIDIGKQPLYSDMFKYANDNLNDKLCMITNSDIYLHEIDINCINKISNNVYSLTRYEHDLTSPLIDNFRGSHDVFMFKSPVNIDLEKAKHVQNVWGSENSIIDNLIENGNKLYNPCYQIKIVHLHASNLRERNRIRITGGKNKVKPSYI